jgi:hypothetical protein
MLKKFQGIYLDFSMAHAMQLTSAEAVDQQKAQLAQGLRSDDTVTDDYSFRSVFQYGKPPGPIKWYDKGDFYRGIRIDVREDIFTLSSTDSKSTMILNSKKGGPNTLGLGTDAKNKYIQVLRPVFINEIRTYLK